MTFWLVECWVARDDEKILAGNTLCASYDLAEKYIKMCAKEDSVPVWQGNYAGYTRYITPETEQMHAMEYIIKPLVVIEKL